MYISFTMLKRLHGKVFNNYKPNDFYFISLLICLFVYLFICLFYYFILLFIHPCLGVCNLIAKLDNYLCFPVQTDRANMQCQDLLAGLNVPGKENIEVCGYYLFPHCISLFFFVIITSWGHN